MLKENFSKNDYNFILRKIVKDKGIEVEFEQYFKDRKNLLCIKHFNQNFFKLNESQQEIVLFVFSLIAIKLSNNGNSIDNLLETNKTFFQNISDNCRQNEERERLEGKFNRMSNCRNSSELIQFIKNFLVRYISLPFDGYALIQDLNSFNYDDFHVLKKWLRDQFYNYSKIEETANV